MDDKEVNECVEVEEASLTPNPSLWPERPKRLCEIKCYDSHYNLMLCLEHLQPDVFLNLVQMLRSAVTVELGHEGDKVEL